MMHFSTAKGRACTQKYLPVLGRRYSTQVWSPATGVEFPVEIGNVGVEATEGQAFFD